MYLAPFCSAPMCLLYYHRHNNCRLRIVICYSGNIVYYFRWVIEVIQWEGVNDIQGVGLVIIDRGKSDNM